MSFSCSSGTDPADNTRLGGEVEFWLGHGGDAQKFVFNEPTAAWVPRGVAHNPWIITKVNNPKHPVMCVVVALTPKYTLEPGATTNYLITANLLLGNDRQTASQ